MFEKLKKIKDNFIPIEKLYNKFFYSDKVASLLLRIPMSKINGEEALVLYTSKGVTKSKLLKAYYRQVKLVSKIQKSMDKFKVYNPHTKKYVQTIEIVYGKGIEYLLLGEILESDFKIKFDYTLEEIYSDRGWALCKTIEAALNRIGAYFIDHNPNTLKSIRTFIKQIIEDDRKAQSDE